ncbi:MAG: hypothetical protein LBB52_02750 [Desulfovibrio sp.]|jgi:alcohol dehydrogenase class IV|nr:hypothetical protein [Desulfovibrio sp.]
MVIHGQNAAPIMALVAPDLTAGLPPAITARSDMPLGSMMAGMCFSGVCTASV